MENIRYWTSAKWFHDIDSFKKNASKSFNQSFPSTNNYSDSKELDIIYHEYAEKYVFMEDLNLSIAEIKSQIMSIVSKLTSYEDRKKEKIADSIYNKHYGYWMLQSYLNNPNVFDVIIFDWNKILISEVINGKLTNYILPPSEHFPSKKHCITFINRLANRLGVVLNSDNNDVKLDDQVHKIRLSIQLKENDLSQVPHVALRSHSELLVKKDILAQKMIDLKSFDFLKRELLNKKGMIVAGPIGSGKTTLCRSLLYDIPDIENQILAIEPYKELFLEELGYKTVYSKTSKGTSIQGSTLEKLDLSGLTFPHNIFFYSEIRESTDVMPFIKKSMTGLGGVTTMHGESAEEIFENLLIRADSKEGVKVESIKMQIYKAIDYIVLLDQFKLKKIVKLTDQGEFVKLRKGDLEC